MPDRWDLSSDRYFSTEQSQRALARELYASVRSLPIVTPHSHVDAGLLADPDATLGTPAELFIIPDHYVFRMLYSQGVSLTDMGVPTRADAPGVSPPETDNRKIWQCFAEHFHLFRGTPTGLWLKDEMVDVFGVREKLTGASAQRVYDHLEAALARPEFSPRALFERFNIETLCTTDGAGDTLKAHRSLTDEGWKNTVRPTFRPDAVAKIDARNDAVSWRTSIQALSEAADTQVTDYRSYLSALEQRREFFRSLGAVSTDHSAVRPHMERLDTADAERIFARALGGNVTEGDAELFGAHMLYEFARMSAEDRMVMQLHVGSVRDHHRWVHERFGQDKGADIPVSTDWTRGLQGVLNELGRDPRFRMVVYTLDESTYSRELAPLAGHYPALYLGAPWWFYDSPNGMRRYLDAVVETAGIYNLAGFNDDTRAFASIPARHDMWRRVVCDWLAGKALSGIVDQEDAYAVAGELAVERARHAYRLQV